MASATLVEFTNEDGFVTFGLRVGGVLVVSGFRREAAVNRMAASLGLVITGFEEDSA